ncbi:MAG TPA: transglutaminaseTgpA domain-containing protein [Actinomycetota bacterium]|nr:transglutaminaseTgpA domain-containing protein [Actinomycetota bacterium]
MGTENRARLALGGLLFATLFTFEQLFEQSDYMGPSLLAALLGGALAIGARRLGWGTAATLWIGAAALFWYLALVFESDHTLYLLPTPAAAAGLARSVLRAGQMSAIDYAPIPSRPGYVMLVVSGMWVSALVGEVASFRWRRPLLGVLPSLALFAYALIVGEGAGSTLMLILWMTALLTFLGLESSHRLTSWGRFLSGWRGKQAEGEPFSGRLGRRMAMSSIAAALIAPLALPALQGLSWRSGSSGKPGGAVSGGEIDLLVDLVPEALRQSDLELFEVQADRASYWRLVSLSDFDGRRWYPSDRIRVPAHFGLDGDGGPAVTAAGSSVRRLEQSYRITGLNSDYLPAAATPTNISFTEPDNADMVLVDPVMKDLRFEQRTTPDLSYEVSSAVPRATYRELIRDRVAPPLSGYSSAPKLSEAVERLRDGWIEGADTDFAKLVALQERLRGTGFEYSTKVAATASTDYLTRFLTKSRTGYCQQFATAFALLSRSLGYPTRVSVGFLPGTDSEQRGAYVVRGTDAHAWPEVLFEGHGWVAFEPTPRTAAPTPTYTIPPLGAGNSSGLGLPGGTVEPPPGGAPKQADRAETLGAGPPGTLSLRNRRPPAWRAAFGRVSKALLYTLLAFLISVPVIKEVRVRRRYARATSPSGAVVAAFDHISDEAAELLTMPRPPSESATSYATRLLRERRAPAEVATLAGLYERARYGPGGASEQEAQESRRLAGGLRARLWSEAGWRERARRLFAPPALRH